MKTCNECGHEKPRSDFEQIGHAPATYRNTCKLCRNTKNNDTKRQKRATPKAPEPVKYANPWEALALPAAAKRDPYAAGNRHEPLENRA